MNTAPKLRTYRGRRFTLGRVAIFLFVIAGFFVWQGSERIPSGPASDTSLNGSPPTTRIGDTLRVATFNIDGKDGASTVDTLRGFDLIGLEEAHGLGPFSKSNQVEVLGNKLNLPWLFAPVERQWWSDAFGDGVLTSLPVRHWQRIPLASESADSNREVLLLQLEFSGRPLNVLITHLTTQDDRKTQLVSVASLFMALQEPVILLGDLNSKNDDPQIQLLRKAAGVIDPIGDSVIAKNGQSWDRIFVRGMQCTNSGFIDKGASDHPLAWAELKLNPEK